VADSFWVSLRYFNFYRIAVAAVFLVLALVYGDTVSLGSHDPLVFTYASVVYLGIAVAFHVMLRKRRAYFNVQLTAHLITDIIVVVVLMYASSGIRSGLGVMLLISLAGAALVSRGKLTLFYAALASIAVLLEQSYWVLVHDFSTASYLQPGMLSIGYFATALITNGLARRLILNERLARQRGADLADQLRINRLVIRDVQDGVLVVDRLSFEGASVVAMTVAQSAAMDYYDRIVDEMFSRTDRLVERMEKAGRAPFATRPLHRFIGTAIGTRNEVLSILHMLDKPDAVWEDATADRIYHELRAEFDLSDRYSALELKLRSVQEALELVLDMARDYRLVLLEATIVLLIAIEIVLSFVR